MADGYKHAAKIWLTEPLFWYNQCFAQEIQSRSTVCSYIMETCLKLFLYFNRRSFLLPVYELMLWKLRFLSLLYAHIHQWFNFQSLALNDEDENESDEDNFDEYYDEDDDDLLEDDVVGRNQKTTASDE